MLLHLLFPDYFERIASPHHKRRVAQTFSGLLAGHPDETIDRQLFAVRQELARQGLSREQGEEAVVREQAALEKLPDAILKERLELLKQMQTKRAAKQCE